MNIQLLGKRVLVLKDKPATHSASGLIELVSPDKEERNTGTIVLCGEEANKTMEGKRCLFQKHCGQKFVFEDEEYLCLFQPDLIALLN